MQGGPFAGGQTVPQSVQQLLFKLAHAVGGEAAVSAVRECAQRYPQRVPSNAALFGATLQVLRVSEKEVRRACEEFAGRPPGRVATIDTPLSAGTLDAMTWDLIHARSRIEDLASDDGEHPDTRLAASALLFENWVASRFGDGVQNLAA